MIELRSATVEDAIALAPRLRQMDLDELIRDEQVDVAQVLAEGVARSVESWACSYNGVVFSIGGIREADDGSGIIWQLGSDEVARHKKPFLAISRRLFNEYKKQYGLIHNFVGQNSHESKRYLRWLGFTIEPHVTVIGSRQVPFQYFWWRGEEGV